MGEIIRVWREAFWDWRYSLLAATMAFSFYLFNVILTNLGSLRNFYSEMTSLEYLAFVWALFAGFQDTLKLSSWISLMVISLSFGVLISLIVFKVEKKGSKLDGKSSAFGIFGAAIGALAPGCAACGIGLVSALGISASILHFLPYEGLELSLLAIALLGFSIYKISKDLTICQVCQIPTEKKMKGGKK